MQVCTGPPVYGGASSLGGNVRNLQARDRRFESPAMQAEFAVMLCP